MTGNRNHIWIRNKQVGDRGSTFARTLRVFNQQFKFKTLELSGVLYGQQAGIGDIDPER